MDLSAEQFHQLMIAALEESPRAREIVRQAFLPVFPIRGANPDPVTTSGGTNGKLPVFTGSFTIGDSIVVQSGTSIGINTSPSFPLDVNGNAIAVGKAASGQGGTIRFRDDAGTPRWLFGLPGSTGSQDFQMYNLTNGHAPLYIENGAPSYAFFFAASGNVGIATNSPLFPLDVNGTVFAVGPKSSKPGYGGTMRFRDDAATVQWALGIPGTSGATDFHIFNLVSNREPLFVAANAPDNMLHITGDGSVVVGGTTAKQSIDAGGGRAFVPAKQRR